MLWKIGPQPEGLPIVEVLVQLTGSVMERGEDATTIDVILNRFFKFSFEKEAAQALLDGLTQGLARWDEAVSAHLPEGSRIAATDTVPAELRERVLAKAASILMAKVEEGH